MPFDAIVILAIVVLDAILGYVQEAHTEEAVSALQRTASLRWSRGLPDRRERAALKDPVPVAEEAALGDRLNMAFDGTAVTRGRRVVVSGATAWHRDGRVARLFGRTESEQTPLHRESQRSGACSGVRFLHSSNIGEVLTMLLGVVLAVGLEFGRTRATRSGSRSCCRSPSSSFPS